MKDTGQQLQRTFNLKDEKITIQSKFSHRKLGFIVYINKDRFFNNGSINHKYPVDTNYCDWRKNAEDRCFKKWLDKKQKKVNKIAEDLLGTCNSLDVELSHQECIWLDAETLCCSVCGWWVEPHEANTTDDITCLECLEE